MELAEIAKPIQNRSKYNKNKEDDCYSHGDTNECQDACQDTASERSHQNIICIRTQNHTFSN